MSPPQIQSLPESGPLPHWAANGVQWQPATARQPIDGSLLSGVTDGLHDLSSAVRGFPRQTIAEWGVVREAYHQGLYHGAPVGLVVGVILAALLLRIRRA